ncbi:MAG: hypothetical protein IJK67_03675 [Bacilli bacterium]|nr:hypothetical protein [Bacilli bacterium]
MKKNKSGDTKIIVVLLLILVVCFAVIGFLFYKYFYSGTSSSKYGDRLEGIENYVLSDSLEEDIQSVYKDIKSVDKVKVTVEGKIIYINIAFKESIKVETAQAEAIKALDKIGENNLTFYDVQYILTYTGEEENENFPVFGAKSSSSLKVVW